MSGMKIAISALLAESTITAKVGQRVYPVYIPTNGALPAIIVHQVGESDPKILDGHPNWPETRISFEIVVSGKAGDAMDIGDALDAALKPKHNYAIAGCIATFTKEGTDVTDSEGEASTSGFNLSARRIIDYTIRWRVAA